MTQLAATIRQSHPLAINWVRELKNLGLVETTSDPEDGRRTLVRLTEAGLLEAERCIATDEVIARVYADLMQEADADVFDALWRMEALCRAVPFDSRLRNAGREENN